MESVTGSVEDVFTSLEAWAKQPFTTQMSVTGWALFTGLVITLTVFWIMILNDLKGEI